MARTYRTVSSSDWLCDPPIWSDCKALQAEGRLLVAGPFPAVDSPDPGPKGFSGSLIVAEFDSLEAAEAWARADPYTTDGVFARVTVKPFKKVLPA